MHNLANTYNNQGKHREAEVLYKQCLDKRKVVLGDNHPETLGTMYNLAGTYGSQDRNRERQCLERIILIHLLL